MFEFLKFGKKEEVSPEALVDTDNSGAEKKEAREITLPNFEPKVFHTEPHGQANPFECDDIAKFIVEQLSVMEQYNEASVKDIGYVGTSDSGKLETPGRNKDIPDWHRTRNFQALYNTRPINCVIECNEKYYQAEDGLHYEVEWKIE